MYRLLQPEFQVVSQVRAALHTRAAPASTTEDVTEHVAENIAETRTATRAVTAAKPRPAVHARMPELVIGGAFLRIG